MSSTHPIQDPLIDPLTGKPATPERERQLMRIYLAQLWEQVWWLSLSPEKRAEYEAQGNKAPIEDFKLPD